MFGNTPLSRVPTFKLVLGFGLCTLGGAMLYAYFSRDEEEEEPVAANNKNGYSNRAIEQKPEKETVIKFLVPIEQVPLLLGRSGTNLKSIEERTNTKIEFQDKDEKQKICQITGLPNGVKDARGLVLNQIERVPIVKEEMYVPQSACGKIMGRCGEAMQEICRQSLAKIEVDSGGRSGAGHERRRITITGTSQQVAQARALIQAKIEEDEEQRRLVDDTEMRREPRRSPANSVNSSLYSSQNSLNSHVAPRDKFLNSKIDDKPMEVYVSAIASPSKFWVQLIGPQTKKLDDMVQSMTEYYGEASNRELHKISKEKLSLGQIVAAIFKYDGKWYRAEIVGILPNQYNPDELVLDLYFVDYGDSEYVLQHEVFELRTDFLTLRFQAVECFLANVKTTLSNTETWDPQAIQKFEELTQVANWKKLISRVVTYKERAKVGNGTATSSAAREGSPIPGVELFDVIEGVDVNIGHMLISHGFALPLEDRPRSPYYRTTTPEHLSYQQHHTISSHSPLATKSISHTTSAALAEDALLDQQLQHLEKNQNLYLNGSGDQILLTNGNSSSSSSNYHKSNEAANKHTTDLHNRNGNLIR